MQLKKHNQPYNDSNNKIKFYKKSLRTATPHKVVIKKN